MPIEKMMSPIRKRSVILDGRRTSLSIEYEFWAALKRIAASHSMTIANLVCQMDRSQNGSNLSSAVRLFVLAHYVEQSAEPLTDEPIAITCI
jgi:predicted DNA-binding ribbon-helix-helix protein